MHLRPWVASPEEESYRAAYLGVLISNHDYRLILDIKYILTLWPDSVIQEPIIIGQHVDLLRSTETKRLEVR